MPEYQERSARLYGFALTLVMLLCGVGFGLFGYSLGPPIGDLTRISGLSEKDFGARGKNTGFAKNHFNEIRYDDLLAGKGAGQIVVFGDSFSASYPENITWTNTLHSLSGRSIKVVPLESLMEVKKYFNSDAFRKAPPDAIIVEMGERTIFRRALSLMQTAKCTVPQPPKKIALRPIKVERTRWVQRSVFNSFDEQLSWGGLAVRLRLFQRNKTVNVRLLNDQLFSSVRSDRLLIYRSDIIRHTPDAFLPLKPEEAVSGSVCAVRDMINSAAGLSAVYIAIAPDKRSVYSEWITSELPDKPIDFPEAFKRQLGDHNIDLYSPLRRAVDDGVMDVYFPNDTHWSALGHALVGKTVAERIGAKTP